MNVFSPIFLERHTFKLICLVCYRYYNKERDENQSYSTNWCIFIYLLVFECAYSKAAILSYSSSLTLTFVFSTALFSGSKRIRLRNAISFLSLDWYISLWVLHCFFSNILCTVIVIEQNTNVNVPGNSKDDLSLSPLLTGPFLWTRWQGESWPSTDPLWLSSLQFSSSLYLQTEQIHSVESNHSL